MTTAREKATARRTTPSREEVLSYFQTLSNWGRWGEDDQLGTLNLITADKRLQAAQMVKEGVTIPLGMDLDPENPDPLGRETILVRRTAVHHLGDRIQGTREQIEMQTHGSPTHMDAPSHMAWDGKLYNGFPASEVTESGGAKKVGIEHARGGVFTRGVLLDIPAVRGVDWLEPGEAIYPEDLDAAEQRQGVEVQQGDVLIARTGYLRRVEVEGPEDRRCNGYHAGCLPWLHERGVSVISCDALNDIQPSGYGLTTQIIDIPEKDRPSIPNEEVELLLPVHSVALVAMGAWLIDNVVVEELLDACQRRGRFEFLIVIEPLRWVGASGSQVNPLAIF